VERTDIDRAGVKEHQVRQHRNQRLVKMNDVELLPLQERLDRVIERDIECDPDRTAVGGNRDRPANAVEAIPHFQTAPAPPWREDRHRVTSSQEFTAQMPDVFEHPSGMGSVIWRNERDLHRRHLHGQRYRPQP
jgi:hypothetical protein